MTKPTLRIHNTETNEIVDREMTDAEYADYLKGQKIKATQEAEAEAKAQAKAALLERLGITQAEANLLLS